ncbi:hypothetical protein [Mucilaginibacter flavus]|uniref:hypothetical protein n=1 Tax=Mucilaginibacter flavus TaxID=931504 RepID=UPI0025B3A83E|nr:hypothetical protein [Mucilaginibacter flavus]MDN3584580.1 hypothetical protein [Mucilaginibacter flavus]
MKPQKKKILLITGSMNQTTQMHAISKYLKEFDCWFSPIFSDSSFINLIIRKTSLLSGTILSIQRQNEAESYCTANGLQMDYRAMKNDYDLILCCTDLILPKRVLNTRTLWVQEGMIDRFTIKSKIVQYLKLPAWACGDTSLNGAQDKCDIYCVASQGYKDYLSSMGTAADKIIVTGIPNFDHADTFLHNSFPHHDYVMVATSDIRETFRFENRIAFIQKAVQIANGRRLLFKLHPNELFSRAVIEIRNHTPADTLILQEGNTGEMIANCQELITQYSSIVFIGMQLGKKVHSFFDLNDLRALMPMQNYGASAQAIANVCHNYLKLNTLSSDTFTSQREARISFLNRITANMIMTFIFKLQPLLLLIYRN